MALTHRDLTQKVVVMGGNRTNSTFTLKLAPQFSSLCSVSGYFTAVVALTSCWEGLCFSSHSCCYQHYVPRNKKTGQHCPQHCSFLLCHFFPFEKFTSSALKNIQSLRDYLLSLNWSKTFFENTCFGDQSIMSLLGNSVILYHLRVCVCVFVWRHKYITPPPACFGVLSNLHSCLKSDALKMMMMDQQLSHIATYRDWEPVDRLPSASLGNLAGQLSNHKFPRSHIGSFDSVQDAMTTLSQ